MTTEVERFTSDPDNMRLFQREALHVEVTEAICFARQKQGVSLKKLAHRLGMKKRELRRYMDGHESLSLPLVADILNELGVRMRVSVENIEYPPGYGVKADADGKTGGDSKQEAAAAPNAVSRFTGYVDFEDEYGRGYTFKAGEPSLEHPGQNVLCNQVLLVFRVTATVAGSVTGYTINKDGQHWHSGIVDGDERERIPAGGSFVFCASVGRDELEDQGDRDAEL